jgi:hypothetical protein
MHTPSSVLEQAWRAVQGVSAMEPVFAFIIGYDLVIFLVVIGIVLALSGWRTCKCGSGKKFKDCCGWKPKGPRGGGKGDDPLVHLDGID